MNQKVIGWCGLYDGMVPIASFTAERKKALVERIKKRRYNFNHFDAMMLPFCSPVFSDVVTCEMTKHQWDEVMAEAYKEIPLGQRLLPQDVITRPPKNGIIFEKEKFELEGDGGNG